MLLLESEALCNISCCTGYVQCGVVIAFSVNSLCVQLLPSSVGHLCPQPKGVPCCCDSNVLDVVLS